MTTPTQTPVVGSIVFSTPTFQRPEDAAAFAALRAELAAAQEAHAEQLRAAHARELVAANALASMRERAQRAEALAEQNAKDAELGQILMRYIDRLTDPTPEDSLEKIVGEMSAAVHAAIDAARKP